MTLRFSDKLEILIKLTALNVIGGKSTMEQVDMLSSVGLKPAEISRIIGKPLNTVTGLIAYLKKKNSGKSKREADV